jgi:hypothetical protein
MAWRERPHLTLEKAHHCHGVKRPHLTLEKAPRAGLGKSKRRELDCYSLACAVCKSANAQNYEEIA